MPRDGQAQNREWLRLGWRTLCVRLLARSETTQESLNEGLANALLTFSSLSSEEFCFFLDFPCDRSFFSRFVGGHKNTGIAEKQMRKPRNPH